MLDIGGTAKDKIKNAYELLFIANSKVARIEAHLQAEHANKGTKPDNEEFTAKILKVVEYVAWFVKRDVQRCREFELRSFSLYESIIPVANLYNALRLDGLAGPWHDMEFLIETLGVERFFCDKRPVVAGDCLKQLAKPYDLSRESIRKLIVRIPPGYHDDGAFSAMLYNLSQRRYLTFNEIIPFFEVALGIDEILVNFDWQIMNARCLDMISHHMHFPINPLAAEVRIEWVQLISTLGITLPTAALLLCRLLRNKGWAELAHARANIMDAKRATVVMGWKRKWKGEDGGVRVEKRLRASG
ncbi:hypothetical protein F4775DRAFT_593076 [Biscogniauxia sp. FL1348]|nr:hypothetical protein F4775DRAFT_593076 [Biscogniauxia sp. FL1348]